GALAGAKPGPLVRELPAEAEANPTDPADLHALRITAKRLRYAIELFADCFPPSLKEAMYPAVERVQEILGEVQDANVGVARLTDILNRAEYALPQTFGRVREEIDALISNLQQKIPAGRELFSGWRGEWLELVAATRFEALTAVVTA
ncbi:MAG: CHAD domain-containing protein, partial [Gemmataceae bacterium]|nr:CHAD domain-containing protein [Gemmataceae bacterium]